MAKSTSQRTDAIGGLSAKQTVGHNDMKD